MSLFSRLTLVQNPDAAIGGEQRATAGTDNAAATGTIGNGIGNSKLSDITAKSGVLLKTLKAGDITNYPKHGDTVTIHYEAYLEEEMISNPTNPDPFDSSIARGVTFQFKLGGNQVIEGMDVAVSKLSIGQKVEATIPYPFAYGVAGYPPVIPPRATLVFRIDLIGISSGA